VPGETEIGLSSGQFFLLFLDWYIQKKPAEFFGVCTKKSGYTPGKNPAA